MTCLATVAWISIAARGRGRASDFTSGCILGVESRRRRRSGAMSSPARGAPAGTGITARLSAIRSFFMTRLLSRPMPVAFAIDAGPGGRVARDGRTRRAASRMQASIRVAGVSASIWAIATRQRAWRGLRTRGLPRMRRALPRGRTRDGRGKQSGDAAWIGDSTATRHHAGSY